MLLLLLSVGLLAVGQSGAGLMGGPKCTWGPTYWCANLQQVGPVGTDGWAQVYLGSHLLVC
jgi:hypothetical protein